MAKMENKDEATMARTGLVLLDAHDRFPELDVKLITGETLKLPEWTGEGYGVVILYRGHW